MHDGGGNRAQTVQALPIIIKSLLRRGFTFVTLQQMVGHLHHLHKQMYQATQAATLAHTIGASTIVLSGYPFSRRRKMLLSLFSRNPTT